MACPKQINLFGFTEYNGRCDFFGGEPVLSQGIGWFIVAGLGAVFALATSVLVWLDHRYGGSGHSSEHFNTAGRSIKAGLTACDIVSKWTWAATLLQSSNVAYKFGVSGPFWYASGATVQVLLFAILAIEVKRKARNAHTVLEIVLVRWGKLAHLVFLVFCLLTNLIVTAMLILGGAAVVEALTGVNIYAAAFLIPVGVMFYTAHGGLKATYLASWAHVAIIYIALCTFMFLIYGSSNSDLGSPGKVWRRLQIQTHKMPIEGNRDHSPLTMYSKDGLIFGIINIIGNFGTVFVDQAYWQSAIAAKPSATYKGYLLGGLAWFAVPFSMATSMGLAARALDLPVTISESNKGLIPPAVASHLLGKGGAFLLVLQLFMAVTASGSAEQIAVSSLVAYDVYRTYINPRASGKQIVLVSRIMVCVYAILSGAMAIILLKIDVSLGWVYLFMGVVIGSAVLPIAFALTWKDCTAAGAITGAIVGQIGAIITWLVVAQTESGELTLESTGKDYPMLAGNLVAICLSGLVCIIISMIRPQNFSWAELNNIPTIDKDVNAAPEEEDTDTTESLNKALKWTYITGGTLSIVLIVLWPLLALPAGVFSKSYFTFWIILSIVWGLAASAITIVLPLWEARKAMLAVMVHLFTCQAPTLPEKDPSVAVKAAVEEHVTSREPKSIESAAAA